MVQNFLCRRNVISPGPKSQTPFHLIAPWTRVKKLSFSSRRMVHVRATPSQRVLQVVGVRLCHTLNLSNASNKLRGCKTEFQVSGKDVSRQQALLKVELS